MLIRRFDECDEITANDGCRLRELLHPDRDGSGLPYSLAVARVKPGDRTLPHQLVAETEVYYILAGRGTMHIDGEEAEVRSGDAVVIPAGAVQWVECSGGDPLEFVALVSPPWRADHDRKVE